MSYHQSEKGEWKSSFSYCRAFLAWRRGYSGAEAEEKNGEPMSYYMVRIEVWCDWDPVASELEEIVENIRPGDAI